MSSSDQRSQDLEVFSSVRDLGPGDLLEFLEQCAGLLPAELRFRLKETMNSFPASGDNLHRVLEVVRRQWEGLQTQKWVSIALVGPARTGKASLIRALEGKEVLSSRPIFSVFDTQGLDEFLGYGRTERVPEEFKAADVVLLVLDAEYEFTDDTVRMVRRLAMLNKVMLVVLNKMDRVAKPRKVVAHARRTLKAPVIPVSAAEPATMDRILRAVGSAYPKAVYPLAQNFPKYKRTICRGIVSQAAFSAGLTGAVPIPISDILPISAIQVAMILKLARVFGFRVDRGRARELLPVLAAGGLVREGAHRLRSMYPQHKRLISISTGALWTYLIGQAAIRYFDHLSSSGRAHGGSD